MTGQVMPVAGARFLRSYVRFVALAAASAVVIIALGYLPTVRLAGRDAVWALAAGCGASWLASCVGAIPVARAQAQRSTQPGMAIMASTTLRFLTALLVVAVLILSGWQHPKVLAVWVGISYLLMLAVDTVFAVKIMKHVKVDDS